MPKYLLTIKELPNTGTPGRLPSGLQCIPETRYIDDKINLAFTHTGLQRDDFASALPAAVIAAITGNGGTAA